MIQLPTVKFKGKMYYVDERLGQLRNVNNPHDFMSQDEYLQALMADAMKKKTKKPKSKKENQMKLSKGQRIVLERLVKGDTLYGHRGLGIPSTCVWEGEGYTKEGFVNMNTYRSLMRAYYIDIRKILGTGKYDRFFNVVITPAGRAAIRQ